MILSFWRYAHLLLAICTSIFLALASLSGAILGFDAANQQVKGQYNKLDTVKVASTIKKLKGIFMEVSSLEVDEWNRVKIAAIDVQGNQVNGFIDPVNGKILKLPQTNSPFIQWVTSLHRSLFLHNLGRAFIGINAFLLIIIVVSGIALVIKRQKKWYRFFSKIVKEDNSAYYHVVTGRWAFIPLLLIAISGTYLSMHRFQFFPTAEQQELIIDSQSSEIKRIEIKDFEVLKRLTLANINKIEFPFSDDPEEFYLIELKDGTLAVNQFSGQVIDQDEKPLSQRLAALSLDVHTGRKSVVWALVLVAASINILYLIYSGFAITLKRRSNTIRNKYKLDECQFILLVGSENGTTVGFAKAVHLQLLALGKSSYLTELNNYKEFPKAKHIIVFTSTHGLGDAPSNANRLHPLVHKHQQSGPINLSVVGFGSRAYPGFCNFALDVNLLLCSSPGIVPLLGVHTVNNKSAEEFNQWVEAWSRSTGVPLSISPAVLKNKSSRLKTMVVVEKSAVHNIDNIFTVRLRPRRRHRFSSGDLLAIYPFGDEKERLYSIGKVKKEIQLVVKLHSQGLGSGFLHQLKRGQVIKTRVLQNPSFHFPQKAHLVAMIANGTGIAPFLGMLTENLSGTETHLYAGFRTRGALSESHLNRLRSQIEQGRLHQLHLCTSQEGEKKRITNLIARDEFFFVRLLENGGVIMMCGSIAMQKDVIQILEKITQEKTGHDLRHYISRGQVLTDCY